MINKGKSFFTSESVTEGHPDKICDQISDAVLDEILAKDSDARVACEVAVCTGLVLIMGEISCDCYVDIPKLVRKTIVDIGYDRAKYGFDGNTCAVLTSINEQSKDIALGVDNSSEYKASSTDDLDETGAGDQGMMFGFACNETPQLMPLPIMLAHGLTRKLSELRKSGELKYLRPDGKAQVTVEYDGFVPKRVDTVVVSTQHSADVKHEQIKKDVIEKVINAVVPKHLLDKDTKYFINPTGKFVIGGPQGDSGLTGRKIIVDTYGGYCPHGGGAFSGKDPTKVDRSAAYMARYVCKHIVAAELADRVQLDVSYAIGIAQPTSLAVKSFGTGKLSDEKLSQLIRKVFDFRPKAIIKQLQLNKPQYQQTAAYGHFGREELRWEQLDKLQELKDQASKM